MTSLTAGDYTLRPFTRSDAPCFAQSVRESMATVGAWMSWARADYSEADALTWFQVCDTVRAAGSGYEFGIFRSDTGTLVGGAGLNQFNAANGFCNLGYWVRESTQRQGAARAAVAALVRYAFESLDLSRIEIVMAVNNAPSLAVARATGAVHECLARNRLRLHGRAVDAHVFAILPQGPHQRPAIRQSIGQVSVVVRDYDQAIDFYVNTLGFGLVQDNPLPGSSKRWVVVSPPHATETRLLLARADTPEQAAHIGNQTGGRVFLFLFTNDFWRDFEAYKSRGVVFTGEPRQEAYGTVAVFQDLYGNQWDLLEPRR